MPDQNRRFSPRALRNLGYESVVGLLAASSVLLLVAPTLIILVMSFTGDMLLRFPPRSWSGRWYLELVDNSPQLLASAWVSIQVALIATVAAGTLGTLAALAIAGKRSNWAVALDAFFMSPMVFPAMSLGLAMLLLLSAIGVRPALWALSIGHTVIVTPFVIRMVSASVQQLNRSLLDASSSLGAGRLFTFFHVTLPLIRPGLIGGGIIAFLSSIDHVPVSLMLSDPRIETLPVNMWTLLDTNLDVRVASISGVIVAITLLVILLLDRRLLGNVAR
ncbi:MAG: ABC transporter permease [Reyranellaceae bacterium]